MLRFWIFLLTGLLSALPSFSMACISLDSVSGAGNQTYRVEHIFDGDTLQLADGRKVRLIAVNTPELGRDGEPDQAFARQALRATEEFIGSDPVYLRMGVQAQDRYGRTLAHVFNRRGESLAEYLIAKGLAFHVAIEPNSQGAECFSGREAQARKAALGLWRDVVSIDVADHPLRGGFGLFRGKITKVSKSKHDIWLEMNGPVVLKAPRELAQDFAFDLTALVGREVEARGWLIDRSQKASVRSRGYKPYLLSLRSQWALRRLP